MMTSCVFASQLLNIAHESTAAELGHSDSLISLFPALEFLSLVLYAVRGVA